MSSFPVLNMNTPNDMKINMSTNFFSKLGLMIVLIFIVIITVKLSVKLAGYLFSASRNPYLFKGLIDGSDKKIFTQDPGSSNPITILRSNNEKDGLEFTWSTWLLIKEGTTNFDDSGTFKHIFSKGNDNILTDNETDNEIKSMYSLNDGMVWPNSSPGLYLHTNKNSLRVTMNTFGDIMEKIDVDGIPVNKWVNVIIRVKGIMLDVYVNGTIVVRHYLSAVPKQNYGSVYVGLNGGFNGSQSCLRYFSYALEPGAIASIVDSGPCLKRLDTQYDKSTPRYLSNRWYFD